MTIATVVSIFLIVVVVYNIPSPSSRPSQRKEGSLFNNNLWLRIIEDKRKERNKKMTRIKIGVDNGNYNTKSSERMLYASGFAMSDREFITSDMQLFYEDAYYAIGGKCMSFQQDKTKENDAFILTLPAIANSMRLVGVSTAEILLGVGLPIDIYGTQKEAFRRYFLREDIHFRFEDTEYHCRIVDCRVFAQGHAALCRYCQ